MIILWAKLSRIAKMLNVLLAEPPGKVVGSDKQAMEMPQSR